MKQIPLDLSADQPQSFDSFVTGRNAELLERLKLLATAGVDKSIQPGSASTARSGRERSRSPQAQKEAQAQNEKEGSEEDRVMLTNIS